MEGKDGKNLWYEFFNFFSIIMEYADDGDLYQKIV